MTNDPPPWTFLTNHGQALLCIATDPRVRLREIAATIGITERAAHRIVGELADAGYITRHREGRRNRYTVHAQRALPDPLARDQRVDDLLRVLGPRAVSQASG